MVVFYNSQAAAEEELILIHKRWSLHHDNKTNAEHPTQTPSCGAGKAAAGPPRRVTFGVKEVTAVHACPHQATTLEKEACFYEVSYS